MEGNKEGVMSGSPSSKIRIVLADNDADLREVLASILVGLRGYHVDTAQDGLEALAIAERTHPHLFILDQCMPFASGFDVCERIRSQRVFDRVGIIIITGLSEGHRLSAGSGIDAVVAEPFEVDELVRTINAVLCARGALREQ